MRLQKFFAAIGSDWLARMSGPLTVPFTIAAFFVSSEAYRVSFALLAVVAALVTSYRVWEKPAARLEALEQARPKIKLNAIHAKTVNQTWGTHIFTDIPFLAVEFINEPAGPYPSARANDVRASISYYRISESEPFLIIDGRWAESDQPSAVNPLASKSHLLAIAFGIGQKNNLDIAYRAPQTGEYFAWNNDNYAHKDFLYPEHLLQGDAFKIEVRLRGEWVDERFPFTFRATEHGFVIDHESIKRLA